MLQKYQPRSRFTWPETHFFSLVTGHFSCSEWDHSHSSVTVFHLFICSGREKLLVFNWLTGFIERLNWRSLSTRRFHGKCSRSFTALMLNRANFFFAFSLMIFISHQVLQGHMTPSAFTQFTLTIFSFFPFNLWWMTMFLKCNQGLLC